MLQYLIRHGESVSNLEGRVQGQEDVELSPTGREQAARVAAWLRSRQGTAPDAAPTVGEVWSSPLRRAHETATVIAAALGLPVMVDEHLQELHAGIFQGHLWADLEARFPVEVARWRSGDVDYAIPGGESRAQLAARGRAALEHLSGRRTPGMIVVAHGGVLTAALGSLFGRGHPLLAEAAERPFTKLPALSNCSVTRLEWPGPRLLAFNETGHLHPGEGA
ncbi:MAG: histidine phosphatase family protein [Planctomycetia bacterium]|nr:histidine phosphatase family protein [Planctomycetia bacterium]